MDIKEQGLERVAQLARHITRTNGSSKYERLHRITSTGPVQWKPCSAGAAKDFQEILYEKWEGIAKLTINRPQSRNAFTAKTVEELQLALTDARNDGDIGVVILTGKGTVAFCSGGIVAVRSNLGHGGTDEKKILNSNILGQRGKEEEITTLTNSGHRGDEEKEIPNLTILDLQMQIRSLPKPVIAMVAGYAIGAGNVLQMVCDLTIAADNAVFGLSQAKLGSFDAGFGVRTMVHTIGARKAKEVWFLARFYDSREALSMGMVSAVVPLAKLEEETVKWCREILANSPSAIRILKAAVNAVERSSDAQALAGNASMYFYGSEEGAEGRRAFVEGRRPDFSAFRRNT